MLCKIKTMLNNNFISLVNQSFPGVNKLFASPQCSAFKDKYYRWCNKNGYYYSDRKANTINAALHICTRRFFKSLT